MAIKASGPHEENVGFFHIAGTCCIIRRGSGDLDGPILPFDREFATLSNVSAYRAYRGFEINTIDTELGIGAIEAQYLRDYGVKVTGGAVKFGGVVHVSGVHSGVAPAAYGTAVWFANSAGGCWGGTWYCETADVGMRIDNSGNKLSNFYSKNCDYRNLWINGQRNSIDNFEIEVKEGVTENKGCEGILIAGQANSLSNGTIGGGSLGPVPGGEVAIRFKGTNAGLRQVIRDVSFVGTAGSSAPLISVEESLNDSTIFAKCFDAGTILDLYTSSTDRLGTSNSISITTDGTVTEAVNLAPTWNKSNRIVVDGLKLRGSITNVSAANPAVITSPAHGLVNGDKIGIGGVGGETVVNSAAGQVHTVSNVTTDTFTVPVDTTGGSSYTAGTGWWGDWEAM